MQKITDVRKIIITDAAMTTERNSMDLNRHLAPILSAEHGLSSVVVFMVVLAARSPEELSHIDHTSQLAAVYTLDSVYTSLRWYTAV